MYYGSFNLIPFSLHFYFFDRLFLPFSFLYSFPANRAVEKGGEAGGHQSPPHFLEQNFFFHVKTVNLKFMQVSNMWDFSLFVE